MLATGRRGLGLQLRPFEVADGARAVRALGRLLGTQQARQHIGARALYIELRYLITTMRVGQGRVQRDVARFALDLQRREVGLGGPDLRTGTARAAQRQRHAADQRHVAALLQATHAHLPVHIGDCRGTRKTHPRFAHAAFVGELGQFRCAVEQRGEVRRIRDVRQCQRIGRRDVETRCAFAPQCGQMLARGDLLLFRARPREFGARKRRLRRQHDRFRRCAGLQSLACTGDGPPTLGDVLLGDGLPGARRCDGKIAARHIRQQVQPLRLALQGERVDAGLRQCAPRIQLAAALQHAGQGQGGLGLAEGARIPAAQRVLDVQPRAQGRPQRRGVEIRLQSASAGIDQAQVGMGTGHARDGIVEREDIRGNNGRWRLRMHARRDREGGQRRQSQPHGESPGSR